MVVLKEQWTLVKQPVFAVSSAPENLSYGAVEFVDAVVIVVNESHCCLYAVDSHYLFVVGVYDGLLNSLNGRMIVKMIGGALLSQRKLAYDTGLPEARIAGYFVEVVLWTFDGFLHPNFVGHQKQSLWEARFQ